MDFGAAAKHLQGRPAGRAQPPPDVVKIGGSFLGGPAGLQGTAGTKKVAAGIRPLPLEIAKPGFMMCRTFTPSRLQTGTWETDR